MLEYSLILKYKFFDIFSHCHILLVFIYCHIIFYIKVLILGLWNYFIVEDRLF